MTKILDTLDDLTPYYRDMLNRLPPPQRRVLCALSRNTLPISATQVAEQARQESRAASMSLTRLKRKGLVRHESRKWAVSDPWLGAWYRLRRFGIDAMNPPSVHLPPKPSVWDSLIMTEMGM